MEETNCKHVNIFDRTYNVSDWCFTNGNRYDLGSGVTFSPQYVRIISTCKRFTTANAKSFRITSTVASTV